MKAEVEEAKLTINRGGLNSEAESTPEEGFEGTEFTWPESMQEERLLEAEG